jgi:thioredoxin-related protein
LYDKAHPLYTTFQNEKAVQAKAYEDFQTDLMKKSNYNARILPILNLKNGKSHRLTDNENEKGVLFNAFFMHKMNIQDLYVSGFWEGIIQSWVGYQANVINDKDKFAQDFKVLHNKITNPVQYTDFVDRVTFYLAQYGKDNYIYAIAPMVIRSGKVTAYEGKTMQMYVKAMIGTQAPDLVITQHIGKLEDKKHNTNVLKSTELATGDYSQTLLVFYQSGCGPCEVLMKELPQKYADLKHKGIRVISISADESEQIFQNSSREYPWPDKYCDYKGKSSMNFSNYAVSGTPTMVLLDKNGLIVQKSASLAEILKSDNETISVSKNIK